ncbi:hypothetical protein V5P93_006568 [Actinokineospora auranticolor]|uniref:hypothetical protein n=1 Tax=Actinokineospora auranticolor TaxID=155976 RepID=UPI0011B07EA4|nr:hypothetical protein [Actinokineospora auranticolor]
MRASLPGALLVVLLVLCYVAWGGILPPEVFFSIGWGLAVAAAAIVWFADQRSVPDSWWQPMTWGVAAGWFVLGLLAVLPLSPPGDPWFRIVVALHPVGWFMAVVLALWQWTLVRPGRWRWAQAIGTLVAVGVLTNVAVFMFMMMARGD